MDRANSSFDSSKTELPLQLGPKFVERFGRDTLALDRHLFLPEARQYLSVIRSNLDRKEFDTIIASANRSKAETSNYGQSPRDELARSLSGTTIEDLPKAISDRFDALSIVATSNVHSFSLLVALSHLANKSGHPLPEDRLKELSVEFVSNLFKVPALLADPEDLKALRAPDVLTFIDQRTESPEASNEIKVLSKMLSYFDKLSSVEETEIGLKIGTRQLEESGESTFLTLLLSSKTSFDLLKDTSVLLPLSQRILQTHSDKVLSGSPLSSFERFGLKTFLSFLEEAGDLDSLSPELSLATKEVLLGALARIGSFNKAEEYSRRWNLDLERILPRVSNEAVLEHDLLIAEQVKDQFNIKASPEVVERKAENLDKQIDLLKERADITNASNKWLELESLLHFHRTGYALNAVSPVMHIDPGQSGKVMLFSVEDRLIVRGYSRERMSWHREIFAATREEMKFRGLVRARISELGGAHIRFPESDSSEIQIYGSSGDYGMCNKSQMLSLLEAKFPDRKITVDPRP